MKTLPNLIVIGAEKSGTSSLHYYLSLHPQIFMSRHKELNFFSRGLLDGKKRVKWYKSNFPFKQNIKIYGESSPSYTIFPKYKGVAQRMYQIIPQAKLIYLVRNPVERLLSHYTDWIRGGKEQHSFNELFNRELVNFNEIRYIRISKYYMQLEKFLKYYSREQILIIKSGDLKNMRVNVLKKIFRFLEVDEGFNCLQFFKEKNVSNRKYKKKSLKTPRYYLLRKYEKGKLTGKVLNFLTFNFIKRKIEQLNKSQGKVKKPVLDKSTYDKLIDIFRTDIKKLQEVSGIDFSDWFDYKSSNNIELSKNFSK